MALQVVVKDSLLLVCSINHSLSTWTTATGHSHHHRTDVVVEIAMSSNEVDES